MVDILKSLHTYGGQAVIEGVMIIGKKAASIAVRAPDGSIVSQSIGFPRFAESRFRTLPFLRGPLDREMVRKFSCFDNQEVLHFRA